MKDDLGYWLKRANEAGLRSLGSNCSAMWMEEAKYCWARADEISARRKLAQEPVNG